jgi:DNA-binding CsgD family transcriptional regulator
LVAGASSLESDLEVQMLDRAPFAPREARTVPSCPDHPGSLVRRYRSHGPNGPGVYPQCVPGGNAQPHLLAWADVNSSPPPHNQRISVALTPSEREVLSDAADGFTGRESAKRRHKSAETVKTQRKQILLKLGARNMTHAVALAT